MGTEPSHPSRSEGSEPIQPGPAPPAPAPDRYLGCTIDNRYKVEGIVGEGGMGVVYQCRHKIIDKRVALKILRADLARDAEVTERFLMEAKAASAIHDEHIIDISDFGQLPDGAAYFVMEFLNGTPLSVIAGQGTPMPIARILPIAVQLTEGLAAAHKMGIVHRDLKPDNVFLIQRGQQSDFVKILDFGIAKVNKATGNGRLTQAGSVFGTPHYMSPEQATGTPLDHRSDIYSLGIILYELATGEVPFDAENFVGILSQQLYEKPVAPRKTPNGAGIPPRFERIILRCLEKKVERRYQSMKALHAELLALQAELTGEQPVAATEPEAPLPPQAQPQPPAEGPSSSNVTTTHLRRPKRWPMYVAIAAPLTVVLFVFVFARPEAQRPATRSKLSEPALQTPVAPSVPAVPNLRPSPPAPIIVKLQVLPAAAEVFVGGRSLGRSPVSVPVPFGDVVRGEVRAKGYEPLPLALDGTRSVVSIDMAESGVPLRASAARRKSGKKAKRRAKTDRARPSRGKQRTRSGGETDTAEDEVLGGQLFVEPWESKKEKRP